MATPPAPTAAVQAQLRKLGWPARQAASYKAVEDFQRGWNLGPALAVDGRAGTKTRAAIKVSLDRLAAGKPTASEHFSFTEAKCHCGGKYAGCAGVRVHRELLHQLERLRGYVRGPLNVRSIYRCQRHNAEVGGASSSQHLYGAACDTYTDRKPADVAKLRGFAGLGYRKRDGIVVHVDVRHVSGNNTTGGTPDRPTTWVYA